jgi:hypothetical protein
MARFHFVGAIAVFLPSAQRRALKLKIYFPEATVCFTLKRNFDHAVIRNFALQMFPALKLLFHFLNA